MSALPIPEGPEALTAGWLTAALRETGTIRAAAIESFELEDPGGIPGLIGVLVRVRPSYNRLESDAPSSLIAKFPRTTEGMTPVLSHNEVRFYQEVADQALLPFPDVYLSGLDPESGRCALLLEDMGGYRVVELIPGCSPEQAKLAVRHIARFHAAWWNDTRLEDYEWLKPLSESYHGDFWKRRLQDHGGEWPEPVRDFAPRLVEHYDHVRALLSTPPRTIVHGDFQSRNTFFGTRRGQREFAIFDFQLVTLGRGVLDVARFLATSLEPKLRRSHEMDLLKEYHSCLGAGGVRDYGFEQCLRDYRAALLWNPVTPLALHVMGTVSSGGELKTSFPILERYMVAVHDWEAEDLFPD